MKIVQSFWSGDRNLIEHAFGWLSPQYHIMAWALSCLKLKEHYDDLHLYTDSNGISILIDYLNLPYKTIYNHYDHINHYDNSLWAMAKILTFSSQEKPFMHVDGDIFIWDKFSPVIENADLLAQNVEFGTSYYKTQMDSVRKDLRYLPTFLENEINKKSISSYNTGLFGGGNIDFIKRYCATAMEIIDNNYPPGCKNGASINFNILFEQVLFSALCDIEDKTVSCLYTGDYGDKGYTVNDFCDFTAVPYRLKYLHLLGGHKRKKHVCALMSNTLFREYPEYFYKIIKLFKNDHLNFDTKIHSFLPTLLTGYTDVANNEMVKKEVPVNYIKEFIENSNPLVKNELSQFEDELSTIINQWKKISGEKLYEAEPSRVDYFEFFYMSREDQFNVVLETNYYLEVLESSFAWTTETKKRINFDLTSELNEILGLAYVPQLFYEGYNEIIIDELDYNILAMLQEPNSFKNMLSNLDKFFLNDNLNNNKEIVYDIALIKLKKLISNNFIFIK